MEGPEVLMFGRIWRGSTTQFFNSLFLIALTLVAHFCATQDAWANISGTVVADGTSLPIAGAVVHLQTATTPSVTTGADGTFTLPVSPSGTVVITAAKIYDPLAVTNYTTNGVITLNGATMVQIRLREIPAKADPDYLPIKAASPGGCGDCHATQFAEWSASNHSLSATDSWVLDLYSGTGTAGGASGYVYLDEHPGEPGTCATCHAPNAEARAPGTIRLNEVTRLADLEGVNCTSCHQLDRFDPNVRNLHLQGATAYRFPLAAPGAPTHEYVWGPLDDPNYPFMKTSHAPSFATSIVCASCHEYDNPTTQAPGQHTYTEWLESAYAVPGESYRTCQSCHMPAATTPGQIANPTPGSAPTRPGEQRHGHGFVGATQESLQGAILLASQTSTSGGRVEVSATVSNAGAGHSFPTGIALRNAMLVIEANVGGQELVQIEGTQVPAWANDAIPGEDAGDHGGKAGFGYAKILSGLIGGLRTSPVLFIEADSVESDTLLLAGTSSQIEVAFRLPEGAQIGETLEVTSRLIYRRAFRALAVTKGWTETPQGGPIEIEIAATSHNQILASSDLMLFADGFESSNTSNWSLTVP